MYLLFSLTRKRRRKTCFQLQNIRKKILLASLLLSFFQKQFFNRWLWIHFPYFNLFWFPFCSNLFIEQQHVAKKHSVSRNWTPSQSEIVNPPNSICNLVLCHTSRRCWCTFVWWRQINWFSQWKQRELEFIGNYDRTWLLMKYLIIWFVSRNGKPLKIIDGVLWLLSRAFAKHSPLVLEKSDLRPKPSVDSHRK
jgi:hypothetical protein